MNPARRIACGTLALLMTVLPFRLLHHCILQPDLRGTTAAAGLPRITVTVVPAAVPQPTLEAAQPPPLNFAVPADQNSRSAGTVATATVAAASAQQAVDVAAYLPVSQLTEWPRRQAPSPLAADDAEEGTTPAARDGPRTLVALLMIDEQGEVRHVQLTDEALEPALRQWLERRLAALRFSPGRLYGRPVGSRLALELFLQ